MAAPLVSELPVMSKGFVAWLEEKNKSKKEVVKVTKQFTKYIGGTDILLEKIKVFSKGNLIDMDSIKELFEEIMKDQTSNYKIYSETLE